MTAPTPVRAKARVLLAGVADLAVGLLLPTLIYLALSPVAVSDSVRLSVGGFFVAAKAVAGRVDADGTDHRRLLRRFGAAVAIAFGSAATTIALALSGASDALSIIAGGAVVAGVSTVSLLRHRRRLDTFALLVLVEIAAGVLLTSLSTDARFVLARPSFYTAIAGLYVLGTVRAARPFMMQVTRPVAAGGDPVRAEAFERAGRESRPFRRAEQAMTAGLGVVLLVEAALRVIVVYSRPYDEVVSSSLLSQLPGVALFVAYLVAVRVFAVPVASREVDALMPGGTPRDHADKP